jgi:hypothetical protein
LLSRKLGADRAMRQRGLGEKPSYPRMRVSSTPQLLDTIIDISEYWIARLRGRRRKGKSSLRANGSQ